MKKKSVNTCIDGARVAGSNRSRKLASMHKLLLTLDYAFDSLRLAAAPCGKALPFRARHPPYEEIARLSLAPDLLGAGAGEASLNALGGGKPQA